MIVFHDPRCAEYRRAGHPERPERIAESALHLKQQHPDWSWEFPNEATPEILLRAHALSHLENIRDATQDFDADTAALPNIYDYAKRGAGSAVDAARAALRGKQATSLMRPPGHHATRDQAMGFCYFNNVAIAAFDAIANGAHRVAIWDFDAHHGNGTEEIVRGDPRIRFSSVHQFPGYPGTGTESFDNIYNFPVPPLTPRATHISKIAEALEVLTDFRPNLLLVSAGFDAYVHDPLTQMTLLSEDFATFGSWLRDTKLEAAAIIEGGYSDDLPRLIDAFLTAWDADANDRVRSESL